ncbi:MAG: DUF3887 domain-containing protein [Christensenellaceae bacterium]|jgi:dienelactone hydrolase
MKKALCIVLAFVFLLGPAGCSASFDQAALMEKSRGYVEKMAADDFESVAADFSAEMAAALSADALRESWHLIADGAGALTGVSDESYSQDNNTATAVVVGGFEHNRIQVTFVYNGKGEIYGLWTSYAKQEILPESTDAFEEYAVTVGDPALPGMVTMPITDAQTVPAVVLIQGSGASDMDETIGGPANKPFRDIAHALAQHGIASIRYNKRTYEYPDGIPAGDITIDYEVIVDAVAAYNLLKEQPGVGGVYIVGHSLGGMFAPEVARQTGAAGMVCLAGSPRSLADIMYDQGVASIDAANVPEGQKAQALAELSQIVTLAKDAKEGDQTMIGTTPGGYWYSMNAKNIPEVVQSLDIPMLFLQGSAYFQVSADKDYTAWQELLAGRENAEFILYDGLNHLFMPTNGQLSVAEYNIPSHVDAQVAEDIAAFIAAQ